MQDDALLTILLQLTQVLKYELYHDSPLCRFLLQRALLSKQVGHTLFWYLKVSLQWSSLFSRI